MQPLTKMLAGAATLGLIAVLAACNTAPGSASGDSGGEGDSINIGVKFDQPGLGLKEPTGNTGFDVEVARYIANELGYGNVEFVEAPSAQRETMIQGGQVDLILATYSITDARAERVTFAGPYFIAGQDLLVQVDSDISGPEALNGKRLCSVTGSTPARQIREEHSRDVELQEYDTYFKCVAALNSGAVDAVTTDNVILAGYAAQPQYAGKLRVVGHPFTTERYGIGLRKGDIELCTRVNEALTKMIDSGEWQRALDETVGLSGFTPDPALNPPAPDPCT